MSLIDPTSRKHKKAKYRQITEHLRDLILRNELKAGTRLSATKELAKEWGTNPFTIQLALTPLVNEGLIERRRPQGTFVRDRTRKIASIGVYFGGNLWKSEHSFYQLIYQYLDELCQQRGSRSLLFVDTRSDSEKFAP